VLGVGLDLFWTRVVPSGEFDVLSEGFSRGQLLATIAALGVGLVVMRPLVRRKALRQRWGEQT
jgi:ER membrane protein complex subunit 1